MPRPDPEALRLAERYQLALAHAPRRGPAGELLGKGTGASLEFQDRRSYFAGDDVRHLDWRAYARSDQLMVRLYREELMPRVELLVDASRSMASDERKAQLAVDLVAILARAARASQAEVRCTLLADEPRPASAERAASEGFEFTGRAPLAAVLAGALPMLRPGAMRILVSDFLSPHEAGELVRPLAHGAGRLALVQVLSAFDAEPAVGSALRLVDAESDEALDLWLDRASVELYRARVRSLADALETECRRASGVFASLRSDRPLEQQCSGELVVRGLLAPA